MNDKTLGGVHWSFRAIGGVALVWNLLGVINFFSQMNANTAAAMPEPYRVIIEARPAWATGAFAIAVFGGMLGCFLLLFRQSAAYYVFIASLLGAIVATIHFQITADFGLLDALIGSLMQVVGAVFLVWYSKWAERKGWIS